MLITIVLTLCHTIAALPQAVCREEIVARTSSFASCLVSQPALAEWKASSRYASEAWSVVRIKCVPGEYVLRDAI